MYPAEQTAAPSDVQPDAQQAAPPAALGYDLAWMARQLGATSPDAWHDFIAHARRFYAHLATALSPDAPLGRALAETLLKDTLQESGLHFKPEPSFDLERLWRQSIDRILRNGQAEAAQAAHKLADPAFAHDLYDAMQAGAVPTPVAVPPMPADKEAEITHILLAPREGDRQATPHIHFTAWGQWLGHHAVAEAFGEHAGAHRVMRAQLDAELPDIPEPARHLLTRHWVKRRSERAHEAAERNLPGSQTVQSAIARSEAARGRAAELSPASTVAHISPQGVAAGTDIREALRDQLAGLLSR